MGGRTPRGGFGLSQERRQGEGGYHRIRFTIACSMVSRNTGGVAGAVSADAVCGFGDGCRDPGPTSSLVHADDSFKLERNIRERIKRMERLPYILRRSNLRLETSSKFADVHVVDNLKPETTKDVRGFAPLFVKRRSQSCNTSTCARQIDLSLQEAFVADSASVLVILQLRQSKEMY